MSGEYISPVPPEQGEPTPQELNAELTACFDWLNKWNEPGYRVESYGNSPSVYLLGEAHSARDQHQKQLELIAMIRPEYVLHELAYGTIYDPKIGKVQIQRGRKFNLYDLPPEEIEELPSEYPATANKVGFKIVGCDLTFAEMDEVEKKLAQQQPEMFEYDEFIWNGMKDGRLIKRDDPDWMNTRVEDEIIPFRDEFMVTMIQKYQALSLTPIVAVMGAHHGNNIHGKGLLKDKGFGYIYVDQTSTL
jgi:hypothetical protein